MTHADDEGTRGGFQAPFDDFEVNLLLLLQGAMDQGRKWEATAVVERTNDKAVLYAYIERTLALAAARAYNNALWEYRQTKHFAFAPTFQDIVLDKRE